MRVAIAGAHGKIAMRLTRRLADRGQTVIGLVRNPATPTRCVPKAGSGRIRIALEPFRGDVPRDDVQPYSRPC